MERIGVKQSTVVVCLVLGLLMGSHRSEAFDYKACYKSCFINCIVQPGATIVKCGLKCFEDCTRPPPPGSLGPVDTVHFCKLGCSMSRCTRLSTKADAREKEVSGCVESCSGMCSKKQH